MADQEWVEMTHPDVGDAPNRVTRKAFDLMWADKGWVVKEETPDEPQPVVSRTRRTSTEGEQ